MEIAKQFIPTQDKFYLSIIPDQRKINSNMLERRGCLIPEMGDISRKSSACRMEDYYSPFSIVDADYVNPSSKKGKPRGRSNKRRFSDEQIRSLESIFEFETRLHPQKKVQVARELGLQPRQVAIWFQNKRARWKSKQLEHEYAVLRDSYTRLSSCLESLKNEKHALVSQVEKLKDLMAKGDGAATASTDGDQSGEDETLQLKMEPPEAAAASVPALPLSDDESSIEAAWYLGVLEERDPHHHQEDSQGLVMSMDMMDRGSSSLTSGCHGPSLSPNSDDHLNPGSPDQWWDFWS